MIIQHLSIIKIVVDIIYGTSSIFKSFNHAQKKKGDGKDNFTSNFNCS